MKNALAVRHVPGSSPRTRGTVLRQSCYVVSFRFIPAHAGNRRHCRPACGRRSVHPRARGEQFHADVHQSLLGGSSPRTRGTVQHGSVQGFARRFIPAHAGNSQVTALRACTAPVHPRARGEQGTIAAGNVNTDGSSPRTRGTGSRPRPLRQSSRFIPAHAGNRHRTPGAAPCPAVHPRARGEQDLRRRELLTVDGSSPRTRGTDVPRYRRVGRGRFIPAHAGNSGCFLRRHRKPPVHPRARGEQRLFSSTASETSGSSPRTRGTAGSSP